MRIDFGFWILDFGSALLILSRIVSRILDFGLFRAPAQLETSQAVVGSFGSSEIEGFHSVPGAPLDGAAHDDVVAEEFLEFRI